MLFSIHKVQTARQEQDFLDVARAIYRDDANWICPLDKQIRNIFRRETNSSFERGSAERWIIKDNSGNFAGRIAAFVLSGANLLSNRSTSSHRYIYGQ